MAQENNKYLILFTRAVIWILVLLLCLLAVFVIIVILWDLVEVIGTAHSVPDIRVSILEYVGEILLVVILLELVDTIVGYAKEHIIRVGSVILVAITAVSRELIIFDYHSGNYLMLFGISAAIISLAAVFLVIGRHVKNHPLNASDDGV